MKILIFVLSLILVACQKESLGKTTRSVIIDETKEDTVSNGVDAGIWVDTTYSEYDFNYDIKY